MKNAFLPLLFGGVVKLAMGDGDAVSGGIFPIGNTRPRGVYGLKNGTDIGLSDGSYILFSEYFYGGVNALDVETGTITPIVPSKSTLNERQAFGIAYSKPSDAVGSGGVLLVAGGKVDPALRIYNATTGEWIADCKGGREDGFLTDVVVMQDYAYVTDYYFNEIYKFNITSATLDGDCTLEETIVTPEDIFLSQTDASGLPTYGASGLVQYGTGLLVVADTAGSLWYIDLEDDNRDATEIIPSGFLPFAGGMTITTDGVLFVPSIVFSHVSVYQISTQDDGSITWESLGEINSGNNLDSPSTTALLNGILYAANSRIANLYGNENGSPATDEEDRNVFAEQFQIVGVDASDIVGNSDGQSSILVGGSSAGSPTSSTSDGNDVASSSRGTMNNAGVLLMSTILSLGTHLVLCAL